MLLFLHLVLTFSWASWTKSSEFESLSDVFSLFSLSVRRGQSSVSASCRIIGRRGRRAVPASRRGSAGEMDAGGEGEDPSVTMTTICPPHSCQSIKEKSQNKSKRSPRPVLTSQQFSRFTLFPESTGQQWKSSTCFRNRFMFRCIINVLCSTQYFSQVPLWLRAV